MLKLTKNDLYSLEKYAEIRDKFRRQVMDHKKNRRVALGEHLFLYFEDRLTMQYQIQEILRVERIFEPSGIDEELSTYNSLIPDGQNLKATCMLEYQNEAQRREALAQLTQIEHKLWMQCEGSERVWAIADEDLERSSDEKTSAVHFLRFELSTTMIEQINQGLALAIGVDHPNYRYAIDKISIPIQDSLKRDFAE